MRIIILLTTVFLMGVFTMLNAEAGNFTLTSTSFLDGSTLNTIYTCDGEDISPQLAFRTAPVKTAAYALILSDPDAPRGTFYHWLLYNMPAETTELVEGVKQLPQGTLVGKNDFGNTKYNGPCPPKGPAHRYIFTLYALDSVLSLPPGVSANQLLSEVSKHTLKKQTITGLYSRK